MDLADERQSAFPPGLRPYVQHVCVRATSYEQLKRLVDRLSGVPSAAALGLELSFGRTDLNLGAVRTIFRRAGLTERVRSLKYCCRSPLGAFLFPGVDMPRSCALIIFERCYQTYGGTSLSTTWSSCRSQYLILSMLCVASSLR